jgi:undecaprenyl-diphosphatase
MDAVVAPWGTGAYKLAEHISSFALPRAVVLEAVVAATVIWWRCGSLVAAATVPAATGLAGIVVFTAKKLVGRPSPAGPPSVTHTSFSFPSGHTAGTTALVVAVLLVVATGPWWRRLLYWLLGTLAISAIGLSMIMLSAHWPTDIAGGVLVGIAAALSVRHRLSSRPASTSFGSLRPWAEVTRLQSKQRAPQRNTHHGDVV